MTIKHLSDSVENRVYDRAELNIDILFPMATTQLTQVFVNPSDDILEAIYQFPVPSESVLGDVQVKVNHQLYRGQIQGANQAESRYEEGVSEGKRSVLVKQLGDGLMEVNVGNLAPRDEVSITLTIHSLLEREFDVARYHLPTCIAPRYGSHSLPDYSTPKNNILAEYPFTANIRLLGNNNLDLIDSTHELIKTVDGARFRGELNQDVSVQLQIQELTSVAYTVEHNKTHLTMASFKPLKARPSINQSQLQLVVDCSGSMGGRSIAQVRDGLNSAVEVLKDSDLVNLIPFGCEPHPLFDRPMRLGGAKGEPENQNSTKTHFMKAIGELDANCGGTEIFSAINVALDQFDPTHGGGIVMLTDGQVWGDDDEVNNIIKRANERGARIFCIGVGDNIDDNFLARLSRETGGSIRRVNPHENMARVIANTVKSARKRSIRCSFTPSNSKYWNNQLNSCLTGEHATYLFTQDTAPSLVGLTSSDSELQAAVQSIPKHAHAFEKALVQLVTNEQLRHASDQETEALAISAGIVSRSTSYVMVSDQAIEGADGLPIVAHLPQSIARSLLPLVDKSSSVSDLNCSRSVDLDLADDDMRFERRMSVSRKVYSRAKNIDDIFSSTEKVIDEDVQLTLVDTLDELIFSHLLRSINFESINTLLDRRSSKRTQVDFSLLAQVGATSEALDQLRELSFELDGAVDESEITALVLLMIERQSTKSFLASVSARLKKVCQNIELDLLNNLY